jgi:hypothetical protein
MHCVLYLHLPIICIWYLVFGGSGRASSSRASQRSAQSAERSDLGGDWDWDLLVSGELMGKRDWRGWGGGWVSTLRSKVLNKTPSGVHG